MGASSLNSVYKKVLSMGGKEQSSMYPPRIYEEHFNITTNWILDNIAQIFPNDQSVVDIAQPFMQVVELPVVNGIVKFQSDYRNMLGLSFNVTSNFGKDCGCKGADEDGRVYKNDPLQVDPSLQTPKPKCISHDIDQVDIDEWGSRTTHPYKFPTYKDPIAVIKKGKEIRVCPYDISYVEITYLKKPKEYKFGYKENPDHTFVFDLATSVESEWEDTALQYLLKGINSLYSIYTRDGEMQNWNEIIKKVGLL